LAAKESSKAKDHFPTPRQQQLFADGDSDQRSQESLLIENTIHQVSLANRMLRPGTLRDPLPGGRIDPFCALSKTLATSGFLTISRMSFGLASPSMAPMGFGILLLLDG